MLQIPNDRSCFYQWDLNQKLIVNDTVHNQVHFADADDSIALVMDLYEKDGQRYVDIPNIFFQNSGRLFAYMCGSSEIEDHTHAVYKFKIKPRPKPDNYVYTETEVHNYNLKLDNNLGSENAGKALIIDENGNIVPGEVQSSGGSGISDVKLAELMSSLQ